MNTSEAEIRYAQVISNYCVNDASPEQLIGQFLMSAVRCKFSKTFIADKLLNSTGRELRRALFTLKQIFQVCSSSVLCFSFHLYTLTYLTF